MDFTKFTCWVIVWFIVIALLWEAGVWVVHQL